MPGSHYNQLNQIIQTLSLIRPSSILDIGIGFGKYGVLSREYLDFSVDKEYGKFDLTIDGIEAFEDYLTPIHKYAYSNVFIGNALDLLPTLSTTYDLILLIDILEHFTYEDGMEFLDKCTSRGKTLFISTPHDIGDHGEHYNNEFEIHKFQWRAHHFKKFENVLFMYNQDSLLAVISKDKELIKRLRKKIFSRQLKALYNFIRRPIKKLVWKITD